jgi:ribosomal-protein-alanine N-acetyltransferase
VRTATLADLGAIVALEARCFGASDGGFTPMQLKRLVGNPRALWHIVDGGLAAACWLRASNGKARWARLYSLAVDPAARRRGLAQLLLNHGLEALKSEGFATARLEVRADNAPALALYDAFGFEVAARLPDYYGRGLDGLRLTRRL